MDAAGDAHEVLRRLTGLVFPEVRRESLEAALARGVESAEAPDLASYLRRLTREPALLDELVTDITIGESWFFRDPEQFEVIRDRMLPALLERRPTRRVRVWSAGCASGEEAYTLAMVLEQEGLLATASVLGTDLSKEALARAQRGRYRPRSLRGVPEEVRSRFFLAADEAFEVVSELRRAVDFRYLNLASDGYPSLDTGLSAMDLILCRNVLIYFDAETVVRVAAQLLDALTPDGWLVIGASDPPLGQIVPCEVVVTTAGLAYRRAGRDRP
jgi:chemotaxis protein methyltransferase CheR